MSVAYQSGPRGRRPEPLTVHGVQLLPRVLEVARIHDLDLGDIADAVLAPEQTWPGVDGTTVVNLRGDLAAISDDDQATVVAVADRDQALRVRSQPRPGAIPKARGGGCGRRFPASVEEVLERLEGHGFDVCATGRHLSVTRPGAPGSVTVPRTPSDWRSIPNAVLQVRRVFGVDLRS